VAEARPNRNGRSQSSARTGRDLAITSLRLENWRNFVRVEVPLQRRVFLVGPNAAGKSNFLDAFRFLADLVAVGGGFQEAVEKRGGVSRIRSLSARRYPQIRIHVAVGAPGENPAWEYELAFSQDNRQIPRIAAERVTHEGRLLIERPDSEDKADPERLTQTYLEQVNVNRDYRELADFFSSISYLHIVPQLVREPDRSVGHRNDPFGGDFLEQLARVPERTRSARLRRIKEALQVAVPQLQELELERDGHGTAHLIGRYEHWRKHGARQDEAHFSDGTLRLLGLLWAVLDGRGPLLLEEPELSLHSAVVRHIPRIFANVQRTGGRQILVSTHSRDLLADDSIGLDEVLILEPGREGATVRLAEEYEEVRALLRGGLSLSDVLLPQTSPKGVEQLALFTA
jgi:predicted ATPase